MLRDNESLNFGVPHPLHPNYSSSSLDTSKAARSPKHVGRVTIPRPHHPLRHRDTDVKRKYDNADERDRKDESKLMESHGANFRSERGSRQSDASLDRNSVSRSMLLPAHEIKLTWRSSNLHQDCNAFNVTSSTGRAVANHFLKIELPYVA